MRTLCRIPALSATLLTISLLAAPSDELAERIHSLNQRTRAAAGEAAGRPGRELPLGRETRLLFDERLALLRRLAADRPDRALSLLYADAELDGLRAAGMPVEEPFHYRGAAAAGVLDIFAEKRAVYFYEIQDPRAGRVMAYLAGAAAPPVDGTVEVSGWRFGDTALLTSSTVLAATQCSSTGEQRVALMLVYPPNTPKPIATAEQYTQAFFGDAAASLTNYYDRASYGRLKVTGRAYGWYQLSKLHDCNSLTPLRDEVMKLADGDVDFSKVDRLHFVMHSGVTATSCTFGGVAYGGCPSATTAEGANVVSASYSIAGTSPSATNRHTPAHELGHNFGMGHARTVKFPDESLGADRAHAIYDEYGDPISIMGGGNSHPAAPHKLTLGWLGTDGYKQVESSGSFTVLPLQSTSGVRALKVRRWPGKDEWLWLEYRYAPDEWTEWSDPRATGAVLHLESSATGRYSELLLGTPPSGPLTDGDDWELRRGAIWQDRHGPLTIELGKATPEGLGVQVRYDTPCVQVEQPKSGVVLTDQPIVLQVSAASNCFWSAKPDELWMTVSQSVDRGAGTLTITPGATPSVTRTGSITVGRTVVPVKQIGVIGGSQVYRITPDKGRINSQRTFHQDLTMLQVPGNDIRRIELSYGTKGGANAGCWLVYDIGTRTMWDGTDSTARATAATGTRQLTSCAIGAIAYSGSTTASEASISYSFKWTDAAPERLVVSARFVNRDETTTDWESPAEYPVGSGCAIYPGNGRLKIPGDATTITLPVDTDAGCQWTASTAADWLKLTQESATGPASFRIAATRNTSYLPRTASIALGERTLEVWQPAGTGTATTVTMLPGELQVSSGESTTVVRAQDSPHLTQIAIASNSPWIQVRGVRETGPSGNIPATWWTTLHVDANPGADARRGSVTFGPLVYEVVQNGSTGVELSPATQVVGPAEASGVIEVYASTPEPWSASSDADWLSFERGGAGSGSGTLAFRAAANAGTSTRTAVVRAGGAMVTVTQAAAGSTVETGYIAQPVAGILPEENIPALSARLDRPGGMAQDSRGNLYVSERNRRIVLRIAPDGNVTRAAGTGLCCFTGDGGDARLARLNTPDILAVDSQDRLYISDRGSCAVRRVDSDGTITTVAGTGTCGFAGDNGPATAARLSQTGIALAADGTLLIADTSNHRIRRVDASGVIGTIAGTGIATSTGNGDQATKATLNSPEGLAVDASGNIVIAEAGANRIRRIAPDGIISTLAGTGTASSTGDGGLATAATVNHPTDVRPDANGNLVVVDYGGLRIRRIDANGTIRTLLGNGRVSPLGDGGPAAAATAQYPLRVHLDPGGDIYFTEAYATGVRRIDTAGNVNRVAGIPDDSGFGGPAAKVVLVDPRAIAVSPRGDVYVADGDGRRVHRFDPAGMHSLLAGNGFYAATTAGPDATKTSFGRPFGLAVAPSGEVIVADYWQHRVLGIAATGAIRILAGSGSSGYTGDQGPAVSARLAYPRSVAVDQAGNIFVLDYNNCSIRRIDSAGIIATVIGNGRCAVSPDGSPASSSLYYAETLAFTADGRLLWTEGSPRQVRYLDGDGKMRSILDSLSTGFSGNGLAPAGPAGLVFADSSARVIRKYTSEGGVLRMAASPYSGLMPDSDVPADWLMLRDATAIASGPDGAYYVTDYRAGRVYKLVPAW